MTLYDNLARLKVGGTIEGPVWVTRDADGYTVDPIGPFTRDMEARMFADTDFDGALQYLIECETRDKVDRHSYNDPTCRQPIKLGEFCWGDEQAHSLESSFHIIKGATW